MKSSTSSCRIKKMSPLWFSSVGGGDSVSLTSPWIQKLKWYSSGSVWLEPWLVIFVNDLDVCFLSLSGHSRTKCPVLVNIKYLIGLKSFGFHVGGGILLWLVVVLCLYVFSVDWNNNNE